MRFLTKIIIVSVVIFAFNVQCLTVAFSQETIFNSLEEVKIYPPESRSTPEIDIPKKNTEKKQSWVSKNKWWVIAGLTLVLAGVAAGSYDNNNDDNNNDEIPGEYPNGKGSIPVRW